MKKINLIDKTSEIYGQTTLSPYYESKIIPPEKKEYIADLKNSVGPYMGIETNSTDSHYMMDAASQIATLGLGFNSLPFFAPVFHSESFTNCTNTKKFQTVRESFEAFLYRKLGWANLATTFCHSGAEANEIALGYCYRRRVNKSARKVLAFQGSFHGRMQISLSSTWNKTKRAPFEWDNYLTEFAPFPNTKKSDQYRPVSNNWIENWENAPSKEFEANLPPSKTYDQAEWELEQTSLLEVKSKLEKGDIFAVIIEPMQCEGGDQYATSRFFNALVSLSKSYGVPVIFDEVQTGYHLGDDFFWHKQFKLKKSNGENLTPDYLVCAKKAQIGMVVSHCDEKTFEEFSVASFYRGYAHAISLDNSGFKIEKIKELSKNLLQKLVNKYKDFIEYPRGLGLCFAFDLVDKSHVADLIKKRFEYGLLYYPAGERTLRFRLNTGFSNEDIEFLFHQLDCLLSEKFFGEKIPQNSPPRNIDKVKSDNERAYNWISLIHDLKESDHKNIDKDFLLGKVKEIIKLSTDESLVFIDSNNIQLYIDQIQSLQKEVYEPSRQTTDEVFVNCAGAEDSICLAITSKEKIVAMSFSAPAHNFIQEKGLSDHEDINKPTCIYTTDTTISPCQKGNKRGRDLKFATVALGLFQGSKIFIGRNRYKLAKTMMDINLSLGGYVYKFSKNDYNDTLRPNDVIHYKIDLDNGKQGLSLSRQQDFLGTSKSFLKKDDQKLNDKIAGLNNKICLSNFVGNSFLKNIDYLLNLAPKPLRHGYTASGQSECVDKIVKSIWHKDKKGQTLISFEGHHFGHGSFLSRAISSEGDEFFPRIILPHPTKENIQLITNEIIKLTKSSEALGIFLEPVGQKTGALISQDILIAIKNTAAKCKVPLIFNETASKSYAYNESYFYAANEDLVPDAIMTYHGGQLATVNLSNNYFLDKPLMLISTWDGDEFSANLASDEINLMRENKAEFQTLKAKLQEELIEFLQGRKQTNYCLENGVGYFEAALPPKYENLFHQIGNRTIVNPSFSALKAYFKQ